MLPREKLITRGVEALTNEDLLGALISTGSKKQNFQKLSKKLLKVIKKDIEEKNDIQRESLTKLNGVGDAKSVKLLAGIELGRRLFDLTDKDKKRIVTSEEAFQEVKDIAKFKQEVVVAIYLNARFELLQRKTISMGTVNTTTIVPRDILIPALELNSAYVVLAHNHPSGNTEASKEDREFTKRLRDACEVIGIKLLDHMVVTGKGWGSIAL